MSEYDDIRALNKTGVWPNKREPDWARRFAKQYDVDSTHIVVQLAGAMQEIERLRGETLPHRSE